jgi:putative phosphoribosyl transferase
MNSRLENEKIVDSLKLRNKIRVFRDRTQAGEILSTMLTAFSGTKAIIMAIPSGGIPVAAVISRKLNLPLEVAPVSKITLPWNTEAGYGAVAFDGTVRFNEELLSRLRITTRQIEEGLSQTRQKVARRIQSFRGALPFPSLSGQTVILVDDGLASGFTMLVAIEAMRNSKARKVIVAVPTASMHSLSKIIDHLDGLYCPNIREGFSFAVAEAYENWFDVPEEDAVKIFKALLREKSQDI